MSLIADNPAIPHVKRWTKQEFIDNVERGFLSKQRVILFRGELIEMPAIGALHALAVKRLNIWLVQKFQGEFEVRTQNPFEAYDETMPQPDGAVYTQAQDARRPHPNAALLLIEVSDSSLEFDQEMALEYAASHVEEYWIINVRDRNIEVYRQSVSDPSSVTGFRYSNHRIFDQTATVAPLFKPDVFVAVSEFMSQV
jgi:Uma2 family endonuclease